MFYSSQFHLGYKCYQSLFFEDYLNIGKKGNTSYGLSQLDLVRIKIETHYCTCYQNQTSCLPEPFHLPMPTQHTLDHVTAKSKTKEEKHSNSSLSSHVTIAAKS